MPRKKGRSEEEEFELKNKRIMQMQGAAEGMIGLGEKWRKKKKSGEKRENRNRVGAGRTQQHSSADCARETASKKIVNQIRQNFCFNWAASG
jgi:hypothetical protein